MSTLKLKLTLLCALLYGITTGIKAQSNVQPNEMSTALSLGFQLNQFQNDFGLGAQLTTPYFFYDRMAVKTRANLMFLEHIEGNAYTWTPYTNISLGLVGTSARVSNFMHLYGEGGVLLILPADNFSSQDAVVGGYGIFGFEFYLFSSGNYFIEIGGVGSGATADKIPFNPIYSNGLSISTGLRFFF